MAILERVIMSKVSKILISSFIVFNFLIMMRVHLPLQSPFISSLYRPIDKYLSFFTLFQTWEMYAPNPSRLNAYLTAQVEFDDKSKDLYEFPRVDKMSIFEKYVYGERMRVITEAIRRDENSFLWKDAAKFAMRKVRDRNLSKIPIRIHLFRHWSITPDMKADFRPHLTKTTNYQKYKFFTYEVFQ